MREPELGREGEFHSDSKCKLVVKDGGRREKEAGSEAIGLDGGRRERCALWCNGRLDEDGRCSRRSDTFQTASQGFIEPISTGLDRKGRQARVAHKPGL